MASATATLHQSWVLLLRDLTRWRRTPAAIVNVALIPVLYFAGFLLPAKGIMDGAGLDYEQYMPPAMMVQAMFFIAMSSAAILAREFRDGFLTRARSMPIARSAPLIAHLGISGVCASLSLLTATLFALLLGFRFEGSVLETVAYFAVLLGVVGVMSLGFGSIAAGMRNGEIVVGLMLIPQMLLIMLSDGFVPLEGFPSWIQPWVEHQPVTSIIEALRALSTGEGVGATLPLAGAWLLVLGAAFAWTMIAAWEHRLS